METKTKYFKIIALVFIVIVLVIFSVRITSDLIYKYKYEPCMQHEPTPFYDNETDTWINTCPEGCRLGSCFGTRTACCPE